MNQKTAKLLRRASARNGGSEREAKRFWHRLNWRGKARFRGMLEWQENS